MKGNRAVLTAVVVILILVLGWWLFRSSDSGGTVDLLAQFESAERRPDPSLFSVGEATLNGDTKQAISVQPAAGTRVKWRLKVPDDGWLRVNLGLKPEAWEQEGNGIKFMVLVSDGRASDELFSQHVNPFGNTADRRWIPVMVDLSAYGGEEVELIFNTYSGPANQPPDPRNDMALWGAPEIVIR